MSSVTQCCVHVSGRALKKICGRCLCLYLATQSLLLPTVASCASGLTGNPRPHSSWMRALVFSFDWTSFRLAAGLCAHFDQTTATGSHRSALGCEVRLLLRAQESTWQSIAARHLWLLCCCPVCFSCCRHFPKSDVA